MAKVGVGVNKTLFDIHYEWLDIISLLEENEGIATEEIEERLNINKDELIEKSEGYCKVIEGYKSDMQLLTERANALLVKANTKQKAIDYLKDKIRLAVNMYGTKNPKNPSASGLSLKTGEHSIWTVFNKPLVIENEVEFNDERFIQFGIKNKLNKKQLEKLNDMIIAVSQQDEDFADLQLITEKSIECKKVKEAIENGETIEGVTLDEEANFVQIR